MDLNVEDFKLAMERMVERVLRQTPVLLNPDRSFRECRLRYLMSLMRDEVSLLASSLPRPRLPALPGSSEGSTDGYGRLIAPNFSILPMFVGLAFPPAAQPSQRKAFRGGIPQRRLVAFETDISFSDELHAAAREQRIIYYIPKWHEFLSMLSWLSPLKMTNPEAMIYLCSHEEFYICGSLPSPGNELNFSTTPSAELFVGGARAANSPALSPLALLHMQTRNFTMSATNVGTSVQSISTSMGSHISGVGAASATVTSGEDASTEAVGDGVIMSTAFDRAKWFRDQRSSRLRNVYEVAERQGSVCEEHAALIFRRGLHSYCTPIASQTASVGASVTYASSGIEVANSAAVSVAGPAKLPTPVPSVVSSPIVSTSVSAPFSPATVSVLTPYEEFCMYQGTSDDSVRVPIEKIV